MLSPLKIDIGQNAVPRIPVTPGAKASNVCINPASSLKSCNPLNHRWQLRAPANGCDAYTKWQKHRQLSFNHAGFSV